MIEPRLFLCGGAAVQENGAEQEGRRRVELNAFGHDPNVTIKITDVARVFTRQVPPRIIDLLEIAAYIFTGDAGTRRGSQWAADAVEPWARDFRFVIPVRDLAFWQVPEVSHRLTTALAFLSDDRYVFDFVPLAIEREAQGYLELGNEDWAIKAVDRVIMFSGGLDSLAGAVEAAVAGEDLVLVSHRSLGQIGARQQKLFKGLKAAFPSAKMLHVPVWVNKANMFGHEPTQRTRSFLFTALAMCVGRMVNAQGVRFYENGVVSLNLPVADEAVRARSSRTTHPHALTLLSQFATLVTETPFAVENPYLYKTKAEVVSTIAMNGAGPLIGLSVSCARPMFKPKGQQHCGICSQCIDRRVAVYAADCESLDPEIDYVCDVFTGPRKDTYERNVAVHYARHAREVAQMSSEQFATHFNLELTRAVRGEPNASDAMARLYELHQRHADAVTGVLTRQLQTHAAQLALGSLEATSMLALVADQQHKRTIWQAYCQRIGDILQEGLLPACRTHQPQDEPHLQELAEGVLAGHDPEITREFPFMRWSASATKPDFSKDSVSLWVEMKYVRHKKDIRPITEDVAADITKYGDNNRRVLFVVYDPKHLIPNDTVFAAEIQQRPAMRVRFIR